MNATSDNLARILAKAERPTMAIDLSTLSNAKVMRLTELLDEEWGVPEEHVLMNAEALKQLIERSAAGSA